jgi:hypothetical protein
MRRLPALTLGLILSCVAVQAAHAADCSNKPGFPTPAEVTKATGLAVDESMDLETNCTYVSKTVPNQMRNQIMLTRSVESRKSFDGLASTYDQDKGMCTKVSGIGNAAVVCKVPGDNIQALAHKGDTLFMAMIAGQVGMGPATAAKLPAQTEALLKTFVAK